MATDISVGIGVQGEKEFKRALEECQNSLKQLDSGLKANAAEFGKNEDAMLKNADRVSMLQKGYNEAVRQIEILGDAVEWAREEYGDLAKETTKYVVAQNKARESAARFAKELEDADQNMTELGRDAGRVGRQLEQGIGEAADDVGRKFDSMVNQLDKNLIDIRGAVEFSALADVGDMLAGGVDVVVNAVSSLTEGTLDYRRQMAILEQNAKDMGFDPEWLKEQAANIAVLTGDMDGAVEAVSNLARVAPDVDSFRLVMDRLLGATIAWPDTFKIENLAESLQESLAGGSLTGAYSELMSRLGLDIETINKSFEEAAKKGSNALWTAGTAWTSEHGFEDTIEEFRKMNADLLEYNQAKIDLTNAEAALAEKMTPAATAGIETFASMIDSITSLITAAEEKFGEYKEEIEQAREEEEEFAAQVDAETGYYSQIEDINEKIRQADLSGDMQGAARLIEERAKVQEDLIQYLQEADQADSEVQSKADEIVQKTTDGVGALFESFGRSLIGDYWYEHIFGDEEDLLSRIDTTGKNMVSSLSGGIDASHQVAIASVNNLINAMQESASRGITVPVGIRRQSVGGTSYASTQTTNVVMKLNEKTLGKATVESSSESLGVAVDRYEMYG